MKYVVCDKKEIHLADGRKPAGSIVDLPDKVAARYLAQGAVERYETKVIRETPLLDAGAAEPLSASPADQASPATIASESEGGAIRFQVGGNLDRATVEQIAKQVKKRGRPRKGSS